jgi:hypothetical protein
MQIKQIVLSAMLVAMAGSVHAVGNLVEVEVHDRAENRALPVYFHGGRYYVVGKPGNEYQVSIRNRQSVDIMTVVSVDGINAVSGEAADWGQTGYVFGPGMSYSISGWRKSLQRVARFFFTEFDNTYAARTGRPENIGVIGIAVFRRKAEPAVGLGRPHELKRDFDRRESANTDAQPLPAQSASEYSVNVPGRQPAAAPAPLGKEKNLGTGHGAGEHSPVRYTSFERASASPDEVIAIYYDSYRNLLAQGIIRISSVARPLPFPGQFVPDPN